MTELLARPSEVRHEAPQEQPITAVYHAIMLNIKKAVQAEPCRYRPGPFHGTWVHARHEDRDVEAAVALFELGRGSMAKFRQTG